MGAFHEIFIDGDFLKIVIGVFPHLPPSWSFRGFAGVQLLEHHDVRGHLGAGVSFEGGVGQPNGPEKFRFRCQILPQRRIKFVHRAA